MGGAALGRQAKILTTAHLELLIRHCQTNLAPLFSDTRPLLAFAEKETHGDLDLLVAYEIPFDPKTVKGEEFGLLDDEGTNLGPAPWHPVQGGSKDKALGKEGEENEAFRKWAEDMVMALKGREWKRSGVKAGLMSVGVPCLRIEGLDHESLGFYVKFNDSDDWSGAEDKVLKEGARKFEKEPFYQVDLQFIPPDQMAFTHFFRSYSNILLSHLITLLSPHLRPSGTHLSFHYSPYPGIAPIKLELTSDPDDFCKWLGLNYDRFLRGFETKKDLWIWVTTVKEGGKAHRVWTGLVRRYKERPEHGIVVERVSLQWKSRNPGWIYFLEWLRLSEESPFSKVKSGPGVVEGMEKAAMKPMPETPIDEKPPGSTLVVESKTDAPSPLKNTARVLAAITPLPQTPTTETLPPVGPPSPAPLITTEIAGAGKNTLAAATLDQSQPDVLAASTDSETGSTVPPLSPNSATIGPDTAMAALVITPRDAEPSLAPIAAPTPAKTASKTTVKVLDPEQPVDLCPNAREALERWGKVGDYEQLLEARKEAAVVMIEAQRAKAEERAREKAEAEAETEATAKILAGPA